MVSLYTIAVSLFFLMIIYCSQFEANRVIDREASIAIIKYTQEEKDLKDFNIYIRNKKMTPFEIKYINKNIDDNLKLNLINKDDIIDNKYLEIKNFKILLNNKIIIHLVFKNKEIEENFSKRILLENKGNGFSIVSEEYLF